MNPEGYIYILGGGSVGIETACYLADAERGHISIVIRRNVVADKEDGGKVNFMRAFCEQRHVDFMFLHTINELTEEGLVLTHKGVAETHPIDWIVLACGYVPVNGLVDELSDLGDKVVVVGDAIKCRDAEFAGNEGFDAGYNA
ncbi:MAG: FAD-dependent oxidoreductase [Eggerthellaceae bacterium]|nr:FAD-dependent oxidoreductase [Eggerthellaceae bacterium]